jgi:hypothetical protein
VFSLKVLRIFKFKKERTHRMKFQPKQKYTKRCKGCGKDVELRLCRVKKFKYCSNKCKNLAKRVKVPKNKTKGIEYTFVKCKSEFCNNGKYLRPFELKRKLFTFCSTQCYHYHRSKQYKLDLEKIKQQQDQVVKKRIWFI